MREIFDVGRQSANEFRHRVRVGLAF
jgi:hypothetical protein